MEMLLECNFKVSLKVSPVPTCLKWGWGIFPHPQMRWLSLKWTDFFIPVSFVVSITKLVFRFVAFQCCLRIPDLSLAADKLLSISVVWERRAFHAVSDVTYVLVFVHVHQRRWYAVAFDSISAPSLDLNSDSFGIGIARKWVCSVCTCYNGPQLYTFRSFFSLAR